MPRATSSSKMEDPVVVVGFSFRLPQEAYTEEGFWDIISNGRSTMTQVPADRFNIDGYYSPDRNRTDTVNFRGGHFVKGDVAAFDAPFFKISQAEAKAMDPQLRFALESVYHTFESVGMPLSKVQGSNTSVYVGNLGLEYSALLNADDQCRLKYEVTGNGLSMLSNKLSWFYDLRGSSVSIDTACSSSLVGLHLACQSLLLGESDMSLVGGVQLQLQATSTSIPLAMLGFVSPDSHCYSFDDRANGYSRGEGVAFMALKRLSKAIADGDTIRAVIRGTGSNQDGRTPAITQPSSDAQEALIRKTYAAAGLKFSDTTYYEAHGTGTAVGDPTETEAIGRVFADGRSPDQALYVGSLKANMGHLEPSAGLVGLIKVIMMFEKGMIPPNALLKNLNPRIHAEKWRLNFPTSCIPWPRDGVRRASVNSFGYGGTNAHAIVDDAFHYLQDRGFLEKAHHNTDMTTLSHSVSTIYQPGKASESRIPEELLFLLTASDELGIQRQASALAEHLAKGGHERIPDYLEDLAYTLSDKRTKLPWKSFVLASSVESLQRNLSGLTDKPIRGTVKPSIQFVFTGQGAQWVAMGRELLRYEVFRSTISEAHEFLQSLGAKWSLNDMLQGNPGAWDISSPDIAQPICTALQIALIDLLASWNISPESVIGHSSGEIAAAYCCSALDRKSALSTAYFRGYYVAQAVEAGYIHGGAMMAVQLSESELAPYIATINPNGSGVVQCGCLNTSTNTTVTGDKDLLAELETALKADGIFARRLNVPVAYHSKHMETVAESYRQELQNRLTSNHVATKDLRPLFFSSVTGEQMEHYNQLSQADYWVRNLVSQVKFLPALQAMKKSWLARSEESNVSSQLLCILEIGPHSTLERSIREVVFDKSNKFFYSNALRRGQCAMESIKKLAGKLAVRGFDDLDIASVNALDISSKSQRKMLLNLPAYAFDHSQTYWGEGRLSRNRRLHKQPRHDFLGLPCNDWNPMRPKWRLILRESDLSWLRDHQVSNTMVYPAAGMLVTALEGLVAVTSHLPSVVGYRLRDVKVGNAIVIPSTDEGVELQLHMDCLGSAFNVKGKSQEYDFRIFSVIGREWKQHCSGKAMVEHAPGDFKAASTSSASNINKDTHVNDILTNGNHINGNHVNGNHVNGTLTNGNSSANHSGAQEKPLLGFASVRERCSQHVSNDRFYQVISDKGIQLGPEFRTLQDIQFSPRTSEGSARLRLSNWQQKAAAGEISKHLVHPATLDGLIHVLFAAMYSRTAELPTLMPTHFSEIYVSADMANREKLGTIDSLKTYGDIITYGIYHIDGTVRVVSEETEDTLMLMKDIRLKGVQKADNGSRREATSLYHRLSWKPDIELLAPRQIEEYCHQAAAAMQKPWNRKWDDQLSLITHHYLSAAIDEWDRSSLSVLNSKPYLTQYISWAKMFLERERESIQALTKTWPGFEDGTTRPQLIKEFILHEDRHRLEVKFLRQLPSILRGEIDPLEILFNDNVAEQFYHTPLLLSSFKRLAAYVDLIAHKNSDLKIIEVGAGTGGATNQVLEILHRHSGAHGNSGRFSRYDFTDISPSFFAHAQDRYHKYSGDIRYKTLNIELDPGEQGFELGSYDIVIAGMVLHATSSIDESLKNAAKLLKPGGKLVVMESTNLSSIVMPCIFGVLPGWWLSTEDYRTEGPLLTTPQWNDALIRAGFEPLTAAMSDNEDHSMHWASILVATMPSSTVSSTPAWRGHDATLPVAIVADTPAQKAIAQIVELSLTSTQVLCEVLDCNQLQAKAEDPAAKYGQCISLVEFSRPILARLDDVQFHCLRNILQVTDGTLIWVTNNCGEEAEDPEVAMFSGFAKTIGREKPKFSSTHINTDKTEPEDVAHTIMHVLNCQGSQNETIETDVIEENGVFMVPRVVEAPQINSLMDEQLDSHKLEEVQVAGTSDRPDHSFELAFEPGNLESIHFKPNKELLTKLSADEVRIVVQATGINFKDCIVALNQFEEAHIGNEFAGTIVEVGVDLQQSFRAGDRVCGVAAGTFKTHLRVKRHQLIKMPPNMSFVQASAVPLAFATALYSIFHVGRLQAGESILIHAAAGGVGQAAIKLAQRVGAKIYVTVSSLEKRQLLIDKCGILEEDCFYSRDTSFAQQLLDKTGGRGVDVVLNSLTGRSLTETWRCIAPLGRFLEIGKGDIVAMKSLPMAPFAKNVTFSSIDLQVLLNMSPPTLQRVLDEVGALMGESEFLGHMMPYPLAEFNRSEFQDAFRYLQTGRHAGKAAVNWDTQSSLLFTPAHPLDYRFDCNATYIISGGLGGIGKSVASWMCEDGAKNLVLLSRSGGMKSQASQELITDLEAKGVCVYSPKCDVSNSGDVQDVISHINRTMPPIKGVIHASTAMVSHTFENYTKESFNASFPSKIQGTVNLDKYLPDGLDFFVILSSVAGINGAPSQSSYSAAATFQDAFARWRQARGERCISLDMGIIQDIGFIAENAESTKAMAKTTSDFKSLRHQDVRFLIKYACNPKLAPLSSPWDTQILAALTTPEYVRRQGEKQDLVWMRLPVFRHLYRMEHSQNKDMLADTAAPDSVGSQIRDASTVAEAAAAVIGAFSKRLARSLSVSVDDIDENKPPYTFGVDSLVAVEFMMWFATEVGSDVPVVKILSGSTVAQLCTEAAEKSSFLQKTETKDD